MSDSNLQRYRKLADEVDKATRFSLIKQAVYAYKALAAERFGINLEVHNVLAGQGPDEHGYWGEGHNRPRYFGHDFELRDAFLEACSKSFAEASPTIDVNQNGLIDAKCVFGREEGRDQGQDNVNSAITSIAAFSLSRFMESLHVQLVRYVGGEIEVSFKYHPLKKLVIEGDKDSRESTQNTSIVLPCENLKELELKNVRFSADYFKRLFEFYPNLETLDLTDVEFLGLGEEELLDIFLAFVREVPDSLKHLNMTIFTYKQGKNGYAPQAGAGRLTHDTAQVISDFVQQKGIESRVSLVQCVE